MNPLYSFIRKATPALVVVALLAGCTLPTSVSDGGALSVQIVQPQEGAQFEVDETVSVISTFSDPGGAQGMILEVNGVGTRDDKFHSPMFEGKMDQPWRPIQNGPATLCVYLSTSDDGKLIRSNCVTVMIGAVERPTFTPGVTNTPLMELTTTPTLTLTPGIPTVTATQDANCRLGPSQDYGVRANLLLNQTAPIVGRNTDSSWWVVNIGGSECWIWDGIVSVAGDTSGTPVITPPLLPTATFTQPAPLTAPSPISPTGTLACASVTGGVTLAWSAVAHPNGINYYEWELTGGMNKSGTTSATQAAISLINCGATYKWRVRAVDNQGNLGPWSGYMQFNVP